MEPGRGHDRPRVLVQLPQARYEQIFTPQARERLHLLADVVGPFPEDVVSTLSAEVRDADVLFLHGSVQVDRAALASAPRLRWISETSGGPPQIDYQTAFARGIVVTDCRRAFARAVAEMALGLYLAVMRDIVTHDRALHTPDAIEGVAKVHNRDASYRTLGLVGFGGLAQALVPFLAPFAPRLLAYDPFVAHSTLAAAGVESVDLHDLFRRCDAVFVLAMPTPENKGLIGPTELDLLGPDDVLLMISRAWLVDEDALIDRLRAGRFRAAIDVFATEPLPANHPYRSLANVVLTPHRAGGTQQSYWRIGDALIADLERFIAGEPPQHNAIVDADTVRRLGRLSNG